MQPNRYDEFKMNLTSTEIPCDIAVYASYSSFGIIMKGKYTCCLSIYRLPFYCMLSDEKQILDNV